MDDGDVFGFFAFLICAVLFVVGFVKLISYDVRTTKRVVNERCQATAALVNSEYKTDNEEKCYITVDGQIKEFTVR